MTIGSAISEPISPNNVSRRWVFRACAKHRLPNASWLTFRRTYASWAHDKGVPGKVVAQLMGHTNADVTINIYQLRNAFSEHDVPRYLLHDRDLVS